MADDKVSLKAVLIVTLCSIIALMGVWVWGYDTGKKSVRADVSKVDTTKSVSPKESSVKSAGTISVPVKLALKDPDEPELPENTILIFTPSKFKGDSTERIADKGAEFDRTASKDTLRAVVPLVQKTFKDSNYTAYVSGFMPKLDSIEVYNKVVVRKETKYRRWNIGITGGVGYGIYNRKPDVFVGVGVTWNLFKR